MKAIVQNPNPPIFEFAEVPTLQPPGNGWVTIKPILSGINVADLAPKPNLQGIVIPGSEVVGIVTGLSPRVRGVAEGDRVVVHPILSCLHKGLPACPRCQAKQPQLCQNYDRVGPLCDGTNIGASTIAGGGWCESFVAHVSMLYPVNTLPAQRAVLAAPTASALHAVQAWSGQGETVAIIGTSSEALLLTTVLTHLHPNVNITLIDDVPFDVPTHRRLWEIGKRSTLGKAATKNRLPRPELNPGWWNRLGAARVWQAAPEEIMTMAAELTSSRIIRSENKLPELDGGFDAVFDTVGSNISIPLSIRLLRCGGSMILGHSNNDSPAINWPLVWSRALIIGGRRHYGHFATVCEWLADPSFPIDGIVTHRFSLDHFSDALAVVKAGHNAGALKVVLEGPGASIIHSQSTAESQMESQLEEGSEQVLFGRRLSDND